MASKAANTGAKRTTGTLNAWLKTPSQRNGQQKKRSRPTDDTMDDRKPAEKKQKSSPPAEDVSNPPSCDDVNSKPTPKEATSSESNTLTLTDHTGDIFAAPANTLIIHACNCQGSWSGGIAMAFKKNYPEAFKVYAKHCRDYASQPRELLGTALLISSVEKASVIKGKVGAPRIGNAAPQNAGKGGKEKKHFIGCLFTSNFYGKRKDSPKMILDATGPAMQDLMDQTKEWNASHCEAERIGELRMCKINSGLFNVPWEDSVDVLEAMEANNDLKEIEVWEREE